MQKLIASKKWLIIYLIILIFLSCFIAIGIALIIYSVSSNNIEVLVIGIATLVYMLPITGIILFYLNQRACWIWVENGCFKWKGLFFGFSGSITPEEVDDIGSDKRQIYIFVRCSKKRMHYGKGIFELSNNLVNRKLLKSFFSSEIYPPELCDICKNIEVGKFETPEEYLDTLSHLKEVITNENYEIFASDYPIDAVQGENGCWVDNTISHIVKCKKCGAYIYCYYDTYHGKGYLSVRK